MKSWKTLLGSLALTGSVVTVDAMQSSLLSWCPICRAWIDITPG
jgi:hypothetical protein